MELEIRQYMTLDIQDGHTLLILHRHKTNRAEAQPSRLPTSQFNLDILFACRIAYVFVILEFHDTSCLMFNKLPKFYRKIVWK